MRSSALKTEPLSVSSAETRGRETVGGERPIDLVHLTRQTFGDKRLETELLRLFHAPRRDRFKPDLDADCGDDAVSCLPATDLLHTLIGSARVVGGSPRRRFGAGLRGCASRPRQGCSERSASDLPCAPPSKRLAAISPT